MCIEIEHFPCLFDNTPISYLTTLKYTWPTTQAHQPASPPIVLSAFLPAFLPPPSPASPSKGSPYLYAFPSPPRATKATTKCLSSKSTLSQLLSLNC